jgi:hypothetical protein
MKWSFSVAIRPRGLLPDAMEAMVRERLREWRDVPLVIVSINPEDYGLVSTKKGRKVVRGRYLAGDKYSHPLYPHRYRSAFPYLSADVDELACKRFLS